MKNWIRKMVERAFDIEELEEALQEQIADRIDYQDIAEEILDNIDITEIAREVAEEVI